MYDVIIIGAGPAGLCSSMFCVRYGLKTLLISYGESQLEHAIRVENYPGFLEISGNELMQKFNDHVNRAGVDMITQNVVQLKYDDIIKVKTESDEEYDTKSIIISTGGSHKKVNIKGENDFIGKGISYCAVCDAPFFKDKKVLVVGGGDNAIESALLLEKYASKVYLSHRRNELKGSKISIDKINNSSVELLYNIIVKEIVGKDVVESIILNDLKTNKQIELDIDGVFINIGIEPVSQLVRSIDVNLNDKSQIITDDCQKTNIDGVFAAGDVTDNKLKQIVTAVSDGAVAAFSAYKYVRILRC